ncbi:hypothetical protein NSA56_11165 [Oceanobacillus caeni]|uniref:hypothetical protein n=1 Tax=Oceanobacillus caeni TaxID=405946 RepID=UPI002149DBC4|nr:hypothetical protein [Oceanobacillus caeni]MCR1834954.1 hypothetical protein [Oceanobacillus caeni]
MKKINVNPALDHDTHLKLFKLAISCNMSKTAMAEKIIKMSVNHTDIIDYFQNIYNTEPDFRVIPIMQDKKVTY